MRTHGGMPVAAMLGLGSAQTAHAQKNAAVLAPRIALECTQTGMPDELVDDDEGIREAGSDTPLQESGVCFPYQ